MSPLEKYTSLLAELGVLGSSVDPVEEARRLRLSERRLLARVEELTKALEWFDPGASGCWCESICDACDERRNVALANAKETK